MGELVQGGFSQFLPRTTRAHWTRRTYYCTYYELFTSDFLCLNGHFARDSSSHGWVLQLLAGPDAGARWGSRLGVEGGILLLGCTG